MGMVVSSRDRSVARRNGGTRLPLGNCCMKAVAVVCAIGRDMGDIAFDLVEQSGQDNDDDVLRRFVYRQMDLKPQVMLVHSVLTHRSMVSLAQPVDSGGAHCATIRSAFERSGIPIGGMNILIAMHAIAEDSSIITNNTLEFHFEHGLAVYGWASQV